MAKTQPRADDGRFKVNRLAIEIPLVEDLSNGERELLRSMAEPGNPLWKIFRRMLDYGDGLQQSLLDVDMFDEGSRRAGHKIQSTIQAIGWVMQTFEQALTPVEQDEENKGNE